MKLPRLDDLIGEQSAVYDHSPDKHLFVAGPPGSGKTTLAVLRARFLADLGTSVVLITRNRMLSALSAELGHAGLNALTMHSFVSRDYSERFKEHIPKAEGPYDFDWVKASSRYAAHGAKPRYDHLVIDEAQNLPAGLFRWAISYGATTLTVFADEDQTTDRQRSSLKEISDAGLPAPVRLTRNHRNTPEIAAVAEHFHRSALLPPGLTTRAASGDVPELLRITEWPELVKRIATRFANRGESIGVVVRGITTAVHVFQLIRAAVSRSARVSIYTSDAPKGSEFGIRLLEPGVTVLTGESSIGLEFDVVYLQDISRSLPCQKPDDCRRMYMLCARARNTLTIVNGPAPLSEIQIADLPASNRLRR